MREARKSITGYLELGVEIIDPLPCLVCHHCSLVMRLDSASALARKAQDVLLHNQPTYVLEDEDSNFAVLASLVVPISLTL